MLSERLEQLRKEKNFFQEDLAKILNVAQTTISSWEKGRTTPDKDMLILLANLFDVSVDYLLGRSDNKNPSNGLHTKTISDEDGYSIEIKTEIPFEKLSKDNQKELIDNAMEKLIEVKKQIREKEDKK